MLVCAMRSLAIVITIVRSFFLFFRPFGRPAGRTYVRHTFFLLLESYSPNLSCDITHQLGIYACADEHQTSARSAVVSSPIGQKNQTKKYI